MARAATKNSSNARVSKAGKGPAATEKPKAEAAAEWAAPASLIPWPKNPRKNDDNVERVAASIKAWGFGSALLARRRDRMIIAGHTRWKAATALGLERIPVRFIDCTDAELRMLALADNKLTERSGWDDDLLTQLLRDADPGDALIAGWTNDELDKLLTESDRTTPLDDDDVPDVPADPVTKLGDRWRLGDHHLVCGDCEDAPSLLDVSGAALMVTDPPYGVSYGSKNAYLNAMDGGDRIETEIDSDDLTPQEMVGFWFQRFKAARSLLRPGAAYYCTGPQGPELRSLMTALDDAGFPLRHMLIWAKQQFVLGRSDYHYQHEPILYGWLDGAAHHAVKDRGESSLWEIDKPRSSDAHPTMKPVELYARAIRNSSSRGEDVIDPFAGSGTLVAACEQVERVAHCIELSPAYCDVIIQRWEALSGGKAQRIRHGG